MAKKPDRSVFKKQGNWVVKKDNDSGIESTHSTQNEAIQASKERITKEGGGELTVHGVDGKIRSKDTIKPGHDPNPPKDKEH